MYMGVVLDDRGVPKKATSARVNVPLTLQDSGVICGKILMSGKLTVKIYKTSIRPALLHRAEMRT